MRILAVGDVVGRPGRSAAADLVSALKETGIVDFAVVNAENAAGGSGLTPGIVKALISSGVDVITTGDHVFRNKEVLEVIDTEAGLLRPLNLSPQAKGRGLGVYKTVDGINVGVANLIGRIYINRGGNPFVAAEEALSTLSDAARIIVVDMHAEATSEKIAMGWFLDGRASLVFGTHTHVQTADACILPGGTAYITDVGMSGPHDGVIGRDKERVLSSLCTDMPTRFSLAKGDVRISGILVDVDEDMGKARSIETFSWLPGSDLPGKVVNGGEAS